MQSPLTTRRPLRPPHRVTSGVHAVACYPLTGRSPCPSVCCCPFDQTRTTIHSYRDDNFVQPGVSCFICRCFGADATRRNDFSDTGLFDGSVSLIHKRAKKRIPRALLPGFATLNRGTRSAVDWQARYVQWRVGARSAILVADWPRRNEQRRVAVSSAKGARREELGFRVNRRGSGLRGTSRRHDGRRWKRLREFSTPLDLPRERLFLFTGSSFNRKRKPATSALLACLPACLSACFLFACLIYTIVQKYSIIQRMKQTPISDN